MVPVLGVMTRPLYEVAPVTAPVKAAVVPVNEPPVNEVPVTAPRLAVVEYKLVAVSPVDEAFPRVVWPVTFNVPFEVKEDVAVIDPPVRVLMVPVTALKIEEKRLVEVALVRVALVAVRLVNNPVTPFSRVAKKLVEVALVIVPVVANKLVAVALVKVALVLVRLVMVVVASVLVPVTERVPVKLAALEIVWSLMRPEVRVVKVEAPVTASVLPRVVAPVMLAVPATVRSELGVVVPMPTLPFGYVMTMPVVAPP